MDRIRIIGGNRLSGAVRISGAKNAALPLMTASLLCEAPLTLTNMPYLADITTMARLLGQHGVTLQIMDSGTHGRTITLDAKDITSLTAPYELVRTMRASVLVLGPLVARMGSAKVSLPGGCAIGTRPIDMHLDALKAMGAEITLEEGYVEAKAPKGGLKGADINFNKVSVGATENAMMAACLAKGTTVISNAAREPEVADLAHMLVAMGAEIRGIGTARLEITGVSALKGCDYQVVGDRIEAGTYLAAAAMTGGDITLKGIAATHCDAFLEPFRKAGLTMDTGEDTISLKSNGPIQGGLDITTQPHPGFPTDMQAQMMTLLTLANGASTITETIFENRFMHVPELTRMGADITLNGRTATIRGVEQLTGAEVMATDLRASSSLVIAALAAKGETVINRVYHLDRGYENMEEKLGALGAKIERIA